MAYNFRREFLCPGGALYYLWNLVFKSSIPAIQISGIDIEERVNYIISRILDGEPEHLPQVKWRAFNFRVCSELLHGLILLYEKKTCILIRDSTSGFFISSPRTSAIHSGTKRLVRARGSRNLLPVYFDEDADEDADDEADDEEDDKEDDHDHLGMKRRQLTKKGPKKGQSLEQRKSIKNIQRSPDQDSVQLPELEFRPFSEDIGGQREELGAAGIDRNLICDTEEQSVREQMARLDINPEEEFGPTAVDEILDTLERNYQEILEFITPLIAPETGEVAASTSHEQERTTPYHEMQVPGPSSQDYEQIQMSNIRELQGSPALSVSFEETELEDLEEPVRRLSRRRRMRRSLRDEGTSVIRSHPCGGSPVFRYIPEPSTSGREHRPTLVEIPDQEEQMVPQFLTPIFLPATQHVPQRRIRQRFDSCVSFPSQGDHGQNMPQITRPIPVIGYAHEQSPPTSPLSLLRKQAMLVKAPINHFQLLQHLYAASLGSKEDPVLYQKSRTL